jgi:hypothetical protein
MRRVVRVLTCVAFVASGLAVADPPGTSPTQTAAPSQGTAPAPAAAPAASTPAAPSAPAASAPPAAAAAAGTKPVVIQSTPEIDLLEKHFLAEGYKIEMHNGEKLFCRREEQLGSHLGGQKVCASAQQLNFTEQEAKGSMNRSMMQQSNLTGK